VVKFKINVDYITGSQNDFGGNSLADITAGKRRCGQGEGVAGDFGGAGGLD